MRARCWEPTGQQETSSFLSLLPVSVPAWPRLLHLAVQAGLLQRPWLPSVVALGKRRLTPGEAKGCQVKVRCEKWGSPSPTNYGRAHPPLYPRLESQRRPRSGRGWGNGQGREKLVSVRRPAINKLLQALLLSLALFRGVQAGFTSSFPPCSLGRSFFPQSQFPPRGSRARGARGGGASAGSSLFGRRALGPPPAPVARERLP